VTFHEHDLAALRHGPVIITIVLSLPFGRYDRHDSVYTALRYDF
jgi:hypothetical protein